MKLSKNIAQKIVKEMMNVIPYNINVMNEKGIIIGSGDLARIGNIHEGAMEAINSKSLNVIHHEEKGVKPGVNEPIIIDDEVIGVIGITGELEEVKRFIKLVRVTAVLLIEQAKLDEEIQDRRLNMQKFYHELAHRKNEYDLEFTKRAETYGFDIAKGYSAILVNSYMDSKELIKICKKYPHNFDVDNNKRVFLIEDEYKYKKIINELNECSEVNKVSIGGKEKVISYSIENAEKTLEIGMKLKPLSKIYHYEDLKFFIHLSYNDKEFIVSIFRNLDKTANNLELMETIQAYIEENGEITNVASRLNIHRNTLNYRLERIQQLTGKNPKNLFELFELLCGLIWL
ncbi:helix-turn-helix domain-containing protein [Clostridium sp. 19966]|uniref:CdaR family transcriptional regulator n=1 Tax=Clostridium sp. 19966 TaxID=2768166 RepID=UPI0028DEC86B|nr:sugar diacid recognition domain-containing protein [Clostridium sp. 19966]MDT8715145.1 helix-turn-helix domain-containing protein [Clostridium sp. 19966]